MNDIKTETIPGGRPGSGAHRVVVREKAGGPAVHEATIQVGAHHARSTPLRVIR